MAIEWDVTQRPFSGGPSSGSGRLPRLLWQFRNFQDQKGFWVSRRVPEVCKKLTASSKIILRPHLDPASSLYVSWDAHFCFIHMSRISTIPIFSHDRHNLVPPIWHGHANTIPAVCSINLLFCPATVYSPSVASNANYLPLLFMAYFQPIYLSWLWHLPCQKRQTPPAIALYFSSRHIIAFSHVSPSCLQAFNFFLFLISALWLFAYKKA